MAGFNDLDQMKKDLERAIPMSVGQPIMTELSEAKATLCHIAQTLRLS